MSTRASADQDSAGASAGSRLSSARAEFVASVGRKVNDARELVAALEDDPSSKQFRDELRRRLHALGAGARLLRLDAMSRSLQEALGVLDRGGQLGALREQEVAFVAQVVDDLPALAWGESLPPPPPPAVERETDEPAASVPITVLVVGDEALADALTDDQAAHSRALESERTEDAQTALLLARAYAPDFMLVDADVTQAAELVAALLDDPLTEPVPILVVGTFRHADDVARFIALGVAKALPKPVSADLLRRALDELLDAREGRTVRVTLGEPTLEQLADRLSEELKRALLDGADRTARSCRVPLGEGTEVMGALWGAIARVQEVVSRRTAGAVRFSGDAPEGTIALAPWLHHDVAASDRLSERGRGAAADVRLQGRRVVVADDDPGVTWFIADLLRTAGCDVHEALDGVTALQTAFRVQPELVVSDILMPGMDGFALSRALRRDVALRDVPVILLSWKEDLLQRVRELGASAAAYMKKESDSRSILARVREVLRPRARFEMRLRGDGEVRGRLDGLTPRLLLELVGLVRKNARVAVRDASYFYEIEIRDGNPRKATRTTSDGGYQSGERALTSLLGVGAGRFVVSSSAEPLHGELTGTLFDQLARPVAAARGAVASSTGTHTMNVERIGLDDASLEEYLRATPDPARSIIKRLAQGDSPRELLLGGEVAPTLLEDVLIDLAGRGAIRVVEGGGGVDLLTPAVEAALGALRGAPRRSLSLPPNARPSVPSVPVAAARRAESPRAGPVESAPRALYRARTSSRPEPDAEDDSGAPSSLEDAVMREIGDRSPNPPRARAPTSNPLPIIEPSALRKRSSSNPPVVEKEDEADDLLPSSSIPPDAVVPATASSDDAPLRSVTRSEMLVASLEAPASPPALLHASPEPDAATVVDAPYSSPFQIATEPLPPPALLSPPEPPVIEPTQLLVPAASRDAERVAASKESKSSTWIIPSMLVLLVAAAGAALYIYKRDGGRGTVTTPTTKSAGPVAMTATAPTKASPIPTASPGAARLETDDEIPPGAELPPGLGMVEVIAPAGARVRIDGAIAGVGPTATLAAAPGYHEIRVEQGGRDSQQVIEVRAGKTTHVKSATAP